MRRQERGGKDSVLALHVLQQDPRIEVVDTIWREQRLL